jgi:hypothetical protein
VTVKSITYKIENRKYFVTNLHIGHIFNCLEFSPMTHKILDISLSTQCNFMKQTAKCSIFHKLSNQIIFQQCDSMVILGLFKDLTVIIWI